jgi:adhesin/invasin
VTAGPPAKLVISRQPGGTAQDGAQLSPQRVVQLQDALGNNVGTAGRTITAALVSPPAGAALGGDATRETDGNGAATFTDLSITGPVGSYTVRFTSGSLTAVTSGAITLTTGSVNAAKSTVNADPNTIAANEQSTVTVTARDVGGNPVQGATVVLAATGSGNTIGQPGSTSASGVATGTFSSTSAGSHTVTAKINGVDIADNSIITVTPGPVSASQSTVSAAPSPITAGGGPSTITVTARDAAGNAISGGSVSLSVTGAGNTVSVPAATNANGVTTATFTSTEAGDHVISATINGVAINQTSTVTVVAGPAASLTFTQQPTITPAGQTITPAVVVAVQDQFGNPAGGTVQMSLVVPVLATGTLSGTLSVAATGGTAAFSDLSVDSPAFLPYRLTATLDGLSTTSDGFLVSP